MAVDPQIKTPSGETYDVLFIGTDHGEVLKMVNTGVETVVVEELQLFGRNEVVLGLVLVNTEILVVSSDIILSVPVERCSVARTCSACVELQDPYCGWHLVSSQCVSHANFDSKYSSEFLQNVTTGRHHLCGDKESPVVILEESKDFDGSQAKTEDQPEDSFQQQGEPNLNLFPTVLLQTRQGRFSTEEFSMAVISVSVSALIIGFIAGFLVSRHCVCGHENRFQVPYLNK